MIILKYITIFNNVFTYNKKKYKIIYKSRFDSHNADINMALLVSENEISKNVIKKFYDAEFYYEHRVHKTINDRLNNKLNDYDVLFCDIENKTFIFKYAGKTLTDEYDFTKYDIKEKLMLFDQLISKVDQLVKIGVIHNDIKPINLCINDNQLILIDYGNGYVIPDEINEQNCFNTSYFSASPEYLILANMESFPLFPEDEKKYNDEQNNFLEIISKTQHMTLAGILIGMLVNEINFYYNTFLEVTQYYSHDIKTNDIENRFDLINEINIQKLSEICLKKMIRKNVNHEIIDIIMNMLSFDYHDRLSLHEISNWLKHLYEEKIIDIKTTNHECIEK